MACGIYAYVRPDKNIISYADFSFVEYCHVKIDQDSIANMYILTIIASERLVDNYAFATRT